MGGLINGLEVLRLVDADGLPRVGGWSLVRGGTGDKEASSRLSPMSVFDWL